MILNINKLFMSVLTRWFTAYTIYVNSAAGCMRTVGGYDVLNRPLTFGNILRI